MEIFKIKSIYLWQYILLLVAVCIFGFALNLAVAYKVCWQLILILPMSAIALCCCVWGIALSVNR